MINNQGKIIAAFGIPGSGKSSTTFQIGKILNIKTFHEPEEEEWGDAVTHRSLVGNFTALMWFRSIRVPQYFFANKLKKSGQVVMMDSCYDKLFYLYYNKKGIDWLFNKDDLYYEDMINISKKDYDNLPDLDILIFFQQTEENWKKFLETRNRNLDNELEFQKSFILQNAFLDSIKQYCAEKKAILIIHNQTFSSPETEAKKIAEQIKIHL